MKKILFILLLFLVLWGALGFGVEEEILPAAESSPSQRADTTAVQLNSF